MHSGGKHFTQFYNSVDDIWWSFGTKKQIENIKTKVIWSKMKWNHDRWQNAMKMWREIEARMGEKWFKVREKDGISMGLA